MATYSAAPPNSPPSDVRLDRTAGLRLCIGTYLDRTFRDYVLHDIYNDRNRRIAPSHGFDLIPVLRHAWRAWWLETCQYLLTAAVLVVWFLITPLTTLIALDVLAIWFLMRHWLRWLIQFMGYGETKDPAAGRLELALDRQLHFRGRLLKLCLSASVAVLLVLTLASVASSGRAGKPASAWVVGTVLGVAEVIGALGAVVAAMAGLRGLCLVRLQSRAESLPRRLSRRMRAIDSQQRHPFTVHSGFKPFIGSGQNIRSWSFAQRLISKDPVVGSGPSHEFDKLPFTARKLVDRLKDRIAELRDDQHPETRLPGLTVTDYVFVDGARAGRFSDVLTRHCESNDVDQAIAKAIENPSDVARHYLAAQVESWGGEIVTSVFVHISLQGRTLYLEFATYALFPVRHDYRVDQVGAVGTRTFARSVGSGLAGLPAQLLATWRLARVPMVLLPVLRAGEGTIPMANLRSDVGAESCVRETAMVAREAEFRAESESGYFQSQDITQHSKIIERRLIAAVDDYLTEVGVDTSEFVQRTTTILNNGIMNTGSGNVEISGSAVGENAQVVTQAGNAEG